jgi:hypothetical protein
MNASTGYESGRPTKKDRRDIETAAQDVRARAWGYFVVGCNLGFLAMTYDSAGVVTPGFSLQGDSVPELSAYPEVMKAAIVMLDSAVTIAGRPAATAAMGSVGAITRPMTGRSD